MPRITLPMCNTGKVHKFNWFQTVLKERKRRVGERQTEKKKSAF